MPGSAVLSATLLFFFVAEIGETNEGCEFRVREPRQLTLPGELHPYALHP